MADKEYIDRLAAMLAITNTGCTAANVEALMNVPVADVAEVVRCKGCKFAKPYERTDGETGYYCMFCGNSFTYGQNWDRQFNPVREENDFCSYGAKIEGGSDGQAT